jgi:hypothetical protein
LTLRELYGRGFGCSIFGRLRKYLVNCEML